MNFDMSSGSLVKRLLHAGSPRDSWDWYSVDGINYTTICELTVDDVTDLIKLVRNWDDPEWTEFLESHSPDDDGETYELLPVTAWRALASLGATECTDPLLAMLNTFAADGDDWCMEDYPHVFGKLGPKTLESLMQFSVCESNHVDARITTVNAVNEIAKRHKATTDEIRRWMIGMLEDAGQHPVEFNSAIMMALLEQKATDAADVIERAFAADRLDVGMAGDWESIRRELGVVGRGLEMPEHPYNSMDEFCSNVGVNVFSSEPLFLRGELDFEAAQVYFETALKMFSASDEGQEVKRRFGNTGWASTFLELGANYLAVTVNNMTLGDASEIVFEIFPRKVSTEPESAEAIVFELRKFWEYVDRAFDLPNAKPMVELFSGDATSKLEEVLSDPTKFGMAKSIFAQGMQAGFDMTTQQGMDQFMLAYNSSLQQNQLDQAEESPVAAPSMSAGEKKAFRKQRQKKLATKLNKKKRR